MKQYLRYYSILSFVLMVVYILSGKLGLTLAFVNASATAVWPPTGIAIATFLIFGYRFWPVIFFGAFIVNFTTAGSIATSLGIAFGNMLEGLVGAYLVNRFAHGVHAFERPRDVAVFALLAGVFATTISATIGVTTLVLGGLTTLSQFIPIWITWWLGDAAGALIVAPLLILLQERTQPRLSTRNIIEFCLLLASLLFTGQLIFGKFLPMNINQYPLEFLALPFLTWIAVRFNPRESAVAIFLLSSLAVWGTIHNQGPFTTNDQNTSLLLLQTFMATISLTILTLAAASFERKTTRVALEHSEKRFRALIEHSADVIVLIDAKANIIYTSPSTKRVLDYTYEELRGVNGFTLVHPEDLEKTQKVFMGLMANPNDLATTQFRIKRKNGQWIWAEATGTNLLHEPAVEAVVINYHDITEQKRLDEAKNEFLSMAAHQLRHPLSAIRWEFESLLKNKTKKFPPIMIQKAQGIYDITLKMIAIVNELLNASRIISGSIPNNPKSTDISLLIEKEIHDIQNRAKEKTVTITFTHDPNLPKLFLDPQRVSAVLQNLLSNSVEYNVPHGTVVITAKQINQHMRITIADSGIGIPVQEQNRIFTKFFRASNATTINNEGTGLGLFLVKSHIIDWGGTITFISPTQKNNHGTTFTIDIPIAPVKSRKESHEKNTHD